MADDTAREEDHEPAENDDEPAARRSDEVAAAVVARFAGSVFVSSHGQPVVYVDRAVMADVAAHAARRGAVHDAHRHGGRRSSARRLAHLAYPGVTPERFEVVVNFLSHTRNRRIRIICEVPASDPTVPSLTPIYPGANFPERESFDLFGITFEGHPDLTRILMPDDWHGHPLRKDDAAARVPVTFKGDPSPR